jgi:hypothetical protein
LKPLEKDRDREIIPFHSWREGLARQISFQGRLSLAFQAIFQIAFILPSIVAPALNEADTSPARFERLLGAHGNVAI